MAHKNCCKPCRRIPPKCSMNHVCPKLCKDKCGPCKVCVPPITLPCGHEIIPMCFEVCDDESKAHLAKRCSVPVDYKFSRCNHNATISCGQSQDSDPACPNECGKSMNCGHHCIKRLVSFTYPDPSMLRFIFFFSKS